MKEPKWIALLLAGGKGTRLRPLTNNIVKPAVPFGGKYRIIDFALSNCTNSGIETVGILTHYHPLALHTHLRNGRDWQLNNRNGGLTILSPLQRDYPGKRWYDGTSHAVYQNIEFIDQCNVDYVLILSADQVYKMDYTLMLQQHIETNAECTVAAAEVPWEEANRFGLINSDKLTGKINNFEEKPLNPTTNLASMGIYIFNWPILKEYLIAEEQKECTHRDFGKDIIPSMLRDGLQLYAYYFSKYWKDVGTVFSFWEANMDLLNRDKNIFLQNPEWRILTAKTNEPPLYLDSGAKIQQSLVSDGCQISGIIEKSILCNGVKVGKGAFIKNSVILPDTIIEENVWIENAVVGSQSLIRNGVIISSNDPDSYLMVVGNHETIDPGVEYSFNINIESAIP